MPVQFKDGDKVYLKPDYAGDSTERFTISQWDDEKNRGWIGDKNGSGWYVYNYQITKSKPKNTNNWY